MPMTASAGPPRDRKLSLFADYSGAYILTSTSTQAWQPANVLINGRNDEKVQAPMTDALSPIGIKAKKFRTLRVMTQQCRLSDTARALIAGSEPAWPRRREEHPEVWQSDPRRSRAWSSRCRAFGRAASSSRRSCMRSPALLAGLIADGNLFARAPDDWLAQEIEARVSGESEAELMESLRRFRRRHMVRIAWRDIAGWATLDETLRDLSMLADVCIDFVCRRMHAALVARYGTPRGVESGEAQR